MLSLLSVVTSRARSEATVGANLFSVAEQVSTSHLEERNEVGHLHVIRRYIARQLATCTQV